MGALEDWSRNSVGGRGAETPGSSGCRVLCDRCQGDFLKIEARDAEVTVRVKCTARIYKMSLSGKLLRDKSEEKDISRHSCADHLRHARNK
jgi:hypothetical protein